MIFGEIIDAYNETIGGISIRLNSRLGYSFYFRRRLNSWLKFK